MNRGIGILSPASYLQNSNCIFQEIKVTKWTPEENKRFENALAVFDRDTPDRWLKVAAMIPGKTVGDVVKQYKELVEDVSDIEAGLIPIPGYAAGNSFTLEWSNNSDGFAQIYCPSGNRGASARPSDQERKKGVPWSEEEHRQFLMGLKKYGKGDWRNISRNFVTTRTPTQVASHAQKYFIRQLTGGKDKRRSSIHDITTVNLPDNNQDTNKTRSPDRLPTNNNPSLPPPPQPHAKTVEDQYCNWPSLSRGSAAAMVFRPPYGGMLMAPFCGISSFGPKLQEQILLRSNFHGCHQNTNASYCSAVLQVQRKQHQ